MNPLKIALSLLMEHESLDKYANLSLSSHKTDALSDEERRLLTVLFYTVIEKRITYDYYISAISGRSIDDVSPRPRNILRLGICQLLDVNSTPDYASVNESVKLAKSAGERAFVNGVLRALARQKETLPLPSYEKNKARYYSVLYSFPQTTVKHFMSLLGEEGAVALFRCFNSSRYTDITVNLNKTDRDTLLARLLADGYSARLSEYSELGIRIEGSVNPTRLYGYSEGLFFVQDEACAVSAQLLAAREGDRIIDVCSAPGGKSFAVASLMRDSGEIFSFDLQSSKLSLIESGAERLGIKSVKVAHRDARDPDPCLIESADRVLCDVPCSGLGILGKKADIRYKSLDTMAELPLLQYEILVASSRYLKRGGAMIYSTCTLNRAENEGVVERFLDAHPDFSLEKIELGALSSDGMLTLYPHLHGTDGFFIAKLRRK